MNHTIKRITLCLVVAATLVAAMAQQEIRLLSLSTNIPPVDFTAATPPGSFPNNAQWNSSNYCHTAHLSVRSSVTGQFWLRWNYALGNPRTNISTSSVAYVGHAFMNVYPKITVTNAGSWMNINVPYPSNSPAGFWKFGP